MSLSLSLQVYLISCNCPISQSRLLQRRGIASRREAHLQEGRLRNGWRVERVSGRRGRWRGLPREAFSTRQTGWKKRTVPSWHRLLNERNEDNTKVTRGAEGQRERSAKSTTHKRGGDDVEMNCQRWNITRSIVWYMALEIKRNCRKWKWKGCLKLVT